MDEAIMSKQKLDKPAVEIERAAPKDAEAILTLKRAAWFAAYPNKEHGITAEDMYKKFTDEDLANGIKGWARGIAAETEGGERMTFVARVNGEVVGYTAPCIEDGQRRIGALYVWPKEQGKGYGSKLLDKALEWHGPDKDIYLHVVSYNQNAIKLYEKFGFERTGKETPEEFDAEQGIKLLPETEMVRKAVH